MMVWCRAQGGECLNKEVDFRGWFGGGHRGGSLNKELDSTSWSGAGLRGGKAYIKSEIFR